MLSIPNTVCSSNIAKGPRVSNSEHADISTSEENVRSGRMSTTTARTGLAEIQLPEISSVIRGKSSTSTPIISETVNKRRRLDSVNDKSSEFLSRASCDINSHSGGESLVNLMMIQSTQREARLDE
jgi:hypothetical protein